jgi:hypothetical protein
MSAFLCSPNHVALLARYAYNDPYHRQRYADQGQTQVDLAETLARANWDSVHHRYPDHGDGSVSVDNYVTECRDAASAFRPLAAELVNPAPVLVIKQAQCFDYQASEPPDYDQSQAATLVRRVLDRAIRLLPGYDAAPWGID